VAEAGYAVSIAELARVQLQNLCLADLANGGRGIRNQLEAHLINPLARALFEQEPARGGFRIVGVTPGPTTILTLEPAA
jgi:ATP-dependent Clp protease ATP-binding subunit ClpA